MKDDRQTLFVIVLKGEEKKCVFCEKRNFNACLLMNV